MSYLIEIAIILILIVLNGIFAMSEFAIASAKRTRLQQRADEGDTGAATELELADDPIIVATHSKFRAGINFIPSGTKNHSIPSLSFGLQHFPFGTHSSQQVDSFLKTKRNGIRPLHPLLLQLMLIAPHVIDGHS